MTLISEIFHQRPGFQEVPIDSNDTYIGRVKYNLKDPFDKNLVAIWRRAKNFPAVQQAVFVLGYPGTIVNLPREGYPELDEGRSGFYLETVPGYFIDPKDGSSFKQGGIMFPSLHSIGVMLPAPYFSFDPAECPPNLKAFLEALCEAEAEVKGNGTELFRSRRAIFSIDKEVLDLCEEAVLSLLMPADVEIVKEYFQFLRVKDYPVYDAMVHFWRDVDRLVIRPCMNSAPEIKADEKGNSVEQVTRRAIDAVGSALLSRCHWINLALKGELDLKVEAKLVLAKLVELNSALYLRNGTITMRYIKERLKLLTAVLKAESVETFAHLPEYQLLKELFDMSIRR